MNGSEQDNDITYFIHIFHSLASGPGSSMEPAEEAAEIIWVGSNGGLDQDDCGDNGKKLSDYQIDSEGTVSSIC